MSVWVYKDVPVPVPSTILLFSFDLIGLAGVSRRKKLLKVFKNQVLRQGQKWLKHIVEADIYFFPFLTWVLVSDIILAVR